jgi:hypothetical protein
LTIKEERKSYVKNVWNWVELAMTSVMGTSIGMYIFLLHYSITVLATQKQGFGFDNFGPMAYHHAVFKRLNAVMLFILLCKVCHVIFLYSETGKLMVPIKMFAVKMTCCYMRHKSTGPDA